MFLEDIYPLIESETPKSAKPIIQARTDVSVLGIGTKRIVVSHPKSSAKVIKIGLGTGVKHNKNEDQLFTKAEQNGLTNKLATIYSTDPENRWIVTDKVKDVCDSPEKFSGPKANQIAEIIEQKLNITLYEIETGYLSNGQVVAYDYGEIV